MKALLFNTFILLFLLAACGYNNTELPSKPAPTGAGQPGNGGGIPLTPTFSTVSQQVFQPLCIRCHSNAGGNKGGVNLETYDNVKPMVQAIWNSIDSGFMPPSGNMPVNAKQVLADWIQAGAPEKANSNGTPLQPTNPSQTPKCDDDKKVFGQISFDEETTSFINCDDN